MKFGIAFPGAHAADGPYGAFGDLPDFSAGYAGFFLGTKFDTDPTLNLFGGAAGVLSGSIGSVGLIQNGSNYLEVPGFSRDIFNVSGAISLVAVAKADNGRSLLADGNSTSAALALFTAGASGAQAYDSIDANAGVVTPEISAADGHWAMFAATFSLAQVQAFIQVSGQARSSIGPIARSPATAPGSVSATLRFGRAFSGAQDATAAILAVYTKVLTSGDLDNLFAACVRRMAEVGERL